MGELSLSLTGGDPEDFLRAVRKGTYEWELPTVTAADDSLHDLMQTNKADGQSKDRNKVDAYKRTVGRVAKSLDAVAGILTRLGLAHPRFDPGSVEEMVGLRGTTVVADTSSVLQGGLDFVARFLHPAVRIKIPAIVHMEVLNLADNFLKRRRATKINAAALLVDHLLSQSGQRVLLTLEIREDTEIERTPLMGDPLRSAFLADNDKEITELNLSVAFRSYCDRLILEAARLHQSHSNPGHRVLLLTADQGLARMALAEGISPLFHQFVKASDVLGRTFSGTVFNPLTADLYRVPLQSVVWELATSFGKARLISADNSRWVEVAAIGSELSWSPVHSRNDLLWLKSSTLADWAAEGASPEIEPEAQPELASKPVATRPRVAGPTKVKAKVTASNKPKRESSVAASGTGYYRFNVDRMFKFFTSVLEEGGRVSANQAQQILGTATPGEYRRFLAAGDLATMSETTGWELTEAGLSLATALQQGDLVRVQLGLSKVPSVAAFLDALEAAPIGEAFNILVPERSRATYHTIGEVLALAAPVVDRGYFPAHRKPNRAQFVDLALARFEELHAGDRFVSVGAWLEALIEKDGVHPVRVREALAETSADGLLLVQTEGSTLDTRHDAHAIQVLRMGGRSPSVEI
ncbi:MAG: hypothetical protein E5X64_09635, partial [Mesorhizobium sp.]